MTEWLSTAQGVYVSPSLPVCLPPFPPDNLFRKFIYTIFFRLRVISDIIQYLSFSVSLQSVWQSLDPSMLLHRLVFHSFLWLSNIPLCVRVLVCVYTTSFFIFFNWRIIALQNFVVFCQASTWISYRYTYVPSLLNLPPISLPIPPF